MTFKHTKFDESDIMKNFEKIAQEKGIVKSEIKKEASNKKDYTPTGNLIVNLLKLCDGLRTLGMEKYATELESNFVMYKKAQALYGVQKEEGEDLVDQAHPQGSHKIEDVDGDSVVETIVDQQKKDIAIVNKKPTGKLTNAKEIINAIKIVLVNADEITK